MNRFSISEPSTHLDFDRCLFSGQVFRWHKTDRGYWGADGSVWYKIERIEDRCEIESNRGSAEFRSLFRLDWNDPLPEILRLAPALADAASQLPGLRLMRPSDPVEVFYTFLCTANNHLKRIMPMVERLAGYGPQLSDAPGVLHRFPRTDEIAAIPEADLRAKGFGYRASTITGAAKEVLRRGGDSWIIGLASLGYETAHRELTQIHGIGNKLADCICLYGLDLTEAVPIDTHMWQASVRILFPQHRGKTLTDRKYREVGDYFRDRFGKLAGWAHLLLYYENMLNWRSRAAEEPNHVQPLQ